MEFNQRIARISAHLQPSNLQMGENPILRQADCRAKGGASGFKVAILGAAGGIGQPLAMLMKMNPLVSVLHLYDVVNSPGVTADISHMDTGAVVRGFLGQQQLENALTGVDLVIIPAGVPRKPGMTRDDLFKINAGIVKTLCEGIAKCCPNAVVNLISNPVNSTVPIAAEVFKKAGTYDPKKLLGVTMLDVVRANTFVAEVLGLDPREVSVPVVGGHAGVTILPLLSQVKPPCSFTPEETEYLTKRIQDGGTEVVQAKAGAGSATLSMAYAAVKFADACLCGLRGDADIIECAFVASQVTELPFFASKVRLGRGGAEEVYQLGHLNEYERQAYNFCEIEKWAILNFIFKKTCEVDQNSQNILIRQAVDVVLSYCHCGINYSTLEDLLPYLKSKGVGVISASPLAMGLLTENSPPEWRPASPELKAACQAAAAHCKKKGKNVLKTTTQFSLSNQDILTILVGMNSIKQVDENVAAAAELATVGIDKDG